MRAAARREDGLMLIELLIAAAIMVVILLATLAVFDSAMHTQKRNATQNDAQEAARTDVDRLARELRNAANPGQPTALARATGTDLVFTMVDPTGTSGGLNVNRLQRVRYCLDNSVPTNEKLWRGVQTWTTATAPAAPASTCPDLTATPQAQIVADHLVNSSAQPVFTYDSTDPASITRIATSVYVDYHPGTAPGPSKLRTAIALRSTAQAPTAAATATPLGNREVLLNGGASTDPSGQALTYTWYDGTTKIGSSALFTYLAPATGSRTFTLNVSNAAGLTSTTSQTVSVT